MAGIIARLKPSNNLLQYPLRTSTQRQNSSSPPRAKLPESGRSRRRSGLEFVDTNSQIRLRVAALLDHGLNQAHVAKQMGLHPTWFNRWVNGKDTKVLSVEAANKLLRYLREFAGTLNDTTKGIETALVDPESLATNGTQKRTKP